MYAFESCFKIMDKEKMRSTVLVYEEDRHFVLPVAMKSFFQTTAGNGRADFFLEGWHTHTGRTLEHVLDPAEADFIFFPYDIGWLIDALGSDRAMAYLRSLPYFDEFESRHVFLDHADAQSVIETEALLFKVSIPHGFKKQSVLQLWYQVPDHVMQSGYSFAFDEMHYDVSFVGTNTNKLRKLIVSILSREQRLRTYLDLAEGDVRAGIFHASGPQFSEADRQSLFRKVSQCSLAMLCLPGLGPLSVRFFEALFFGRVPIVLKDVGQLPFQGVIDYERFCIFLSLHDLQNLGEVLYRKLHYRKASFKAMCEEACATWHGYFSENARHAFLCQSIVDEMEKR